MCGPCSKKRLDDDYSAQVITSDPHVAGATVPPHVAEIHNEVHIWGVQANESTVAMLAAGVSPVEYAYANRFVMPGDRIEFLVSRGLVRFILSHYLNMPPDEIRFNRGHHGKPELDDRIHGSRLRFSLSHSCGMVLLAVTVDHEIGIDIEFVDSRVDFDEFAFLVFSSAEVMSISQLPLEERQRAYFQCWTRKEAFVKALGEGLSERIRQLEVIASDGSLLPHINAVAADDRWTVKDLNVRQRFVSAVAVADCNCSFRFWEWPG
jgi:4'-phosphopantetheinyl transferase